MPSRAGWRRGWASPASQTKAGAHRFEFLLPRLGGGLQSQPHPAQRGADPVAAHRAPTTDARTDTPDYDNCPLPAFPGPAETPDSVINETDWAPLWHATSHPTTDTPVILKRLLFPATQASALRFINDALTHQNSIYPATVPAIRYVAAVLGHPRVAPVRAELLDWLSRVLRDFNDSVMAWGEAEYAHLMPMRPTL